MKDSCPNPTHWQRVRREEECSVCVWEKMQALERKLDEILGLLKSLERHSEKSVFEHVFGK